MLRHLQTTVHRRHWSVALCHNRLAHYKAPKPVKPPSPPKPPNPPKKPRTFTFHDHTWEDPYSWMSELHDKVAMRHMDMYMEQEEKYTEAVLSDTDRLQSKLQSEMASRLNFDLSTPPLKWGPWLYYRRVEEGKPYPVLCRRLVSLNQQFISYKSPSAGFDFTSGKRIEQKLLDYNQEAERFGGYSYEELSEISPDHRFLAYTMYDKDSDCFKLSVRNLNSGALCSKPQADHVSSVVWAKDGQALVYAVTNENKRPYRIYCSTIGSTEDDVLLLEESDETVYLNLRNTKDFHFVKLHAFSPTSSKVFLMNAADPLSGMTLVWECEGIAHCVVEHHQGSLYLFTNADRKGHLVDSHYLLRSPVAASSTPRIWENVFLDDDELIIEDADFCNTHLVLITRKDNQFGICSVALPLPSEKQKAIRLRELQPHFLPLPKYICKISPGPNYDFYSSTMRFTLSSPVMPDAVVDYNLSDGKWNIIQQQNMLYERTRILYGTSLSLDGIRTSGSPKTSNSMDVVNCQDDNSWNDLSDFYACDHHYVTSHDGVRIPLTVVYSRKNDKNDKGPALLHGHGAYGEILDKSWRSELKSLLDRGWTIAYADARGGGGCGIKWHHDGRRVNKQNSISDFISCAKYLIHNELAHDNKLAGWGYSAGGLLVASAINCCPDLFRAAVLKVPFLDATNTLLHPILPLTAQDYEEFGYPEDIEEFHAIRKYSPYDNIQSDALYPAVLLTSSFNTRFGVWEAAKWIARVREMSIYDPKRPILLNLTADLVEDNRYLQCKESALEMAFLLKMMES